MQESRVPWWRDARRRTRAAAGLFLGLCLAGMLFAGFTSYLFAGDQRVLVVTMDMDAGQAEREALKQACGGLPGVTVVADRGDDDPRLQGRFTVRFDIAGTSQQQETALLACVNDQRGVRGFLTENDGN